MSLSDAYYASFYLQMLSYILPIWVGCKFFYSFDKLLKLFFLSIIISFFIDLSSWVLAELGRQNHYLDYFFSFNSFFTKIFIFAIFIKDKTHRKIAIGVAVIIIPIFVVDSIWIAGAKHHNAFSGSIANGWILVTTLYCMQQLIKDTTFNLSKQPLFWILLGITIKRVLTFADSLFSDYILNSSVTLAYILYSFTYLVNVAENIIYSRGFYYAKK